jgi:hypothetical protein
MTTQPTTPRRLFAHTPHPHVPQNVNAMHQAEHAAAGWNTRLAVALTNASGTMICTYLFACIGIGSLVGVFTNNPILAAACGAISSYFLQLVFLPVLQTGTKVLNRHAELQADEEFSMTEHLLHDNAQLIGHLDAQDQELLRQTQLLTAIQTEQGKQLATLLTHLIPKESDSPT